MSTLDITTTESLWTRVGQYLSTWGRKIKAGTTKVLGFIARGAKRLYNTKAAQWVVSKTKYVAGWAWHYAKGPVGWIAAPIAAVIFAPKAVAVMLVLVLLAVAGLGFIGYKAYQHLKTITTAEELREMQEEFVDAIREPSEPATEIGSAPTADETIGQRLSYLDKKLQDAQNRQDMRMFSELTGRMYLLAVRNGDGTGKLPKNAPARDIHRECRRDSEKNYSEFSWNFGAMWRAIQAEDKRLKDIAVLKTEQKNLTSV